MAHLSKALQAQVGASPGDYAVFRPESRSTAKVVSSDVGVFLQAFSSPVSIASALLAFARVTGGDPEVLLDRLFPVVNDMLVGGFLMTTEEAALARASSRSELRGIGGYVVLRELQRMDDVAVYCVRAQSGVLLALKLGVRADPRSAAALQHEADVMRRLDGGVTPRLAASGHLDGRPFLAMEWVHGVTADRAADSIRSESDGGGLPRLLRLAAQVAAAYAALHEGGVLHGDIHPRNVLVSDKGVRIIDLGLSSVRGRRRRQRGGIDYFAEPEYAAAYLKRKARPAANEAGEQYSVAALLYRLLTGSWYLPFALEKDAALQQIAEAAPLAFAAVGAASHDGVEATLLRALQKHPGQRFGSMRAFADAMAGHAASASSQNGVLQTSRAALDSFVAVEVGRLLAAGSDFALRQPLRAAVNMGLGGVAYGAYRLALNLRSPELLAFADEVAERAAVIQDDDDALFSDHLGLTRELVLKQSCFNAAPGVSAVRLLVSHARGDAGGVRLRLREFLRQGAGIERCGPDFTFGQAGTLATCANLLPVAACHDVSERAALRRFGDGVEAALLTTLGRMTADGTDGTVMGKTGAAHGLAGFLFAILQWRWQTNQAAPPEVCELLDRLGRCGMPLGRGTAWPHVVPFARPEFHGGWCNGAAGLVQVWLAAFRAMGDPRWLALAEQAAWSAWDAADGTWDLCCGRAGRSYAFLELANAGGDKRWRERAVSSTMRTITEMQQAPVPYVGLYRGAIGVVLLASDVVMAAPRSMPFFGSEP